MRLIYSLLLLLLFSQFCSGQTLYSQGGVSLTVNFKYVKEEKCGDAFLDKYDVIFTVKNNNPHSIRAVFRHNFIKIENAVYCGGDVVKTFSFGGYNCEINNDASESVLERGSYVLSSILCSKSTSRTWSYFSRVSVTKGTKPIVGEWDFRWEEVIYKNTENTWNFNPQNNNQNQSVGTSHNQTKGNQTQSVGSNSNLTKNNQTQSGGTGNAQKSPVQNNNTNSYTNAEAELKSLIDKKNKLCPELSQVMHDLGEYDNGKYSAYCHAKQYTINEIGVIKGEIIGIERIINDFKARIATKQSRIQQEKEDEQKRQQQFQQYNQEQQRIQYENQRIAVQSQQFINVYNEGVSLNNQGKYTEAAAKYQEALGLASNATQRQQAQDAYNRTNKTGRQVEAIKQGGEALVQVASAIQQAVEQRKAEIAREAERSYQQKIELQEAQSLELERLVENAENGSYDAQHTIAKNYYDKLKDSRDVLHFYEMALKNPSKNIKDKFMGEYLDELAFNGKHKKLTEILFNPDFLTNYPGLKNYSAYMKVFCSEYFSHVIDCSDKIIQQGVDELDRSSALYAYMEVTGDYERFGVIKNQDVALKKLLDNARYSYNKDWLYFSGEIYRKGTSSIKKDPKKALRFYEKAATIIKKNEFSMYLENGEWDRSSLFDPVFLSHIRYAQLNENEMMKILLKGMVSFPKIVLGGISYYHIPFVPKSDLDFVTKYSTPYFLPWREFTFSNLNTNPEDKFGLPKTQEESKVSVVLINYSPTWCKTCDDQIRTLKETEVRYNTIQVDINQLLRGLFKESAFIVDRSRSTKKTVYIGGSRTFRDDHSGIYVKKTNLDEFNPAILTENGELPLLYFYKGGNLVHSAKGLLSANEINAIIRSFNSDQSDLKQVVIDASSLIRLGNFPQAYKMLKHAADLGYDNAMGDLGILYYRGDGVQQNYNEAKKWVTKSAESGDLHSIMTMGIFYEEGSAVSQSYEEAIKWYTKSAEGGYIEAMYRLGSLYALSIEGVTNDAGAVKWLTKAAESGHIDAMYRLAIHYFYGSIRNETEGMKWLNKAAELGNVDAMTTLGSEYEYSGNFEKSMKWLSKAAELGEAIAMLRIGRKFRDGIGVPIDYQEAIKWLDAAATDLKDKITKSIAALELAKIYDEGAVGVKVDWSKASIYYEMAASDDYTTAIERLIYLFETGGNGLKKNLEKAKYWRGKL